MTVPTGESPLSAGITPRSQASGKLVCREACSEVSQTTMSVLTNTPEHGSAKGAHAVPYTEATRSDEVTQHTEVPAFRKEGSTKVVDRAGIGTRIFTLPREISRCLEHPREVSRGHSS